MKYCVVVKEVRGDVAQIPKFQCLKILSDTYPTQHKSFTTSSLVALKTAYLRTHGHGHTHQRKRKTHHAHTRTTPLSFLLSFPPSTGLQAAKTKTTLPKPPAHAATRCDAKKAPPTRVFLPFLGVSIPNQGPADFLTTAFSLSGKSLVCAVASHGGNETRGKRRNPREAS